jgi:PAS domain S-box-containing protein
MKRAVVTDRVMPASAGAQAAGTRRWPRRLSARPHSFRLQTALVFGGLTVVICAALSFVLGDMLTTQIRRDSITTLDSVAQGAARTLASGLSQRMLETRVLAGSSELWADGLGSPAVSQALARVQATQPFNSWIGVADSEGRVMAAASGMLVGQSVKERPWFGRGLVGPHVGDIHRALLLEKLLPRTMTGEPIRFVDFAAPIKSGDKVIGVLGVHGTWDWSRDVIASLMPADAASRELQVFIFDRVGKVLLTPANEPAGPGAVSSIDQLRPPISEVRADGRIAAVTVWPDGRSYLTTVATMPAQSEVTDMGWQVVVREPADKAFARVGTATWQAFIVGLLLSALAGLLAWYASGVMSRPLTRLARAARDVQLRVPGADIDVLHDNDEVHQLSSALAGMVRCLDATYRTAPVGMCQTDIHGRVLSANDRLSDLLGVTGEDMPGRSLDDLIDSPDLSELQQDMRALGRGRAHTVARELRLTPRNAEGDRVGADRTVSLSAAMVPPMDDAPAFFVIVMEDVSSRIAAEAAHQANAAKTAFLSQVSHELRTPLNAVLGFSQLMKLDAKERLSERQTQRVDSISGAGRHLLAMIDDLLDLTQIESDKMTLSTEPVSLPGLLEQSLTYVAEAARAADVTIRLDPPPAGSQTLVIADRVRLQQVLLNLLSNSIKYNRAGGTVVVAWMASLHGDRMDLTVTDTGRGIRPDQLVQLFQPFNRLGAETSTVQGTGIGLVITRKLVEMMGGKISVRSTIGVGTCFAIELPMAGLQTIEPLSMTRPADLDAAPLPSGHEHSLCRVMYVEDNEVNVLLLSAALEMRPNIELEVARNGSEALALAQATRPDVFLLDMHLGDMTGIELAQRLKKLPGLDSVPMVAVSADATPQAMQVATEAGFTAYLSKPLHLRSLLKCLDDLSDARSGAVGAAGTAGAVGALITAGDAVEQRAV